MELVLQLITTGLAIGSIYALVAMGFALIYGTTHHFHIAHIGVLTGTGYVTYVAASVVGLPLLVSLLVAVAGGALLGTLIVRFLYTPLEERGASHLVVFIASLGLLLAIENLIIMNFGSQALRVVTENLRTAFLIGPLRVTWLQLLTIVAAAVFFASVMVLLRRTSLGASMRAAASNPELVEVAGRSLRRIHMSVYAIGSGITAVAGFVTTVDAGIVPGRGHNFFIIAVMAVILGGFGSVKGAYWAALGVGLIEAMSLLVVPAVWSLVIVFGLFVIIIVARPQGLFVQQAGVGR
jgi:branched-chain amino acid transport system permease protein